MPVLLRCLCQCHRDNLIGESSRAPNRSAKSGSVERHGGSAMRKAIACGVVCCALAAATMEMGAKVARAQAKPAQNAVQALDHGWQLGEHETGWPPARTGRGRGRAEVCPRAGLPESGSQSVSTFS